MKIKALSNIQHDGQLYETGSVFDIDDVAGQILIDSDVAVLSTRKDELVAEAEAKAKAEEAEAETSKPQVKSEKVEAKNKK